MAVTASEAGRRATPPTAGLVGQGAEQRGSRRSRGRCKTRREISVHAGKSQRSTGTSLGMHGPEARLLPDNRIDFVPGKSVQTLWKVRCKTMSFCTDNV